MIYTASVIIMPDLDFSIGPPPSDTQVIEPSDLPPGRKDVGGKDPKFYEIIKVKASDKKN